VSGGAHRYVLVVDGREIELSDGEVTLGRSRSSTVRVDHESVSRSHALVTFRKGTAVLKDLNSSNGTFVAGRRILNETILRSGDRLQLGAAVVEYRLADASEPIERTALLTPSVAVEPPDPRDLAAGLPADPSDVASPASAALEISAADLFRGVDDEARRGGRSPVVASAALAAVHSSGVTDRPVLDFPPEEDAPGPAGAPPAPPPPPPVRDATLSQFPIRNDSAAAAPAAPVAARPAPAVRVRKPRPSAAWPARGPEAGGFFPRLLASLVDGVILLALNLLLLSPVFLVLLFREAFQTADLLRDWAFLGILAGCGLMIFGANLWYVVGGWARTGRTPGKALLRLSVVAVAPAGGAPAGIGLKRAFLRFLAWNLSGGLLGIGFLLVLFRKDRRALHDLLAGTRVVRTP